MQPHQRGLKMSKTTKHAFLRSDCRALQAFFDDWKSKKVCIWGGVNTGKSWYGLAKCFLSPKYIGRDMNKAQLKKYGVKRGKIVRCSIIRESESSYDKALKPNIEKFITPDLLWEEPTKGMLNFTSYFYDETGLLHVTEWVVVSLNSNEAINKLWGGEFDLFYINELGGLDGLWDSMQRLDSRLGREFNNNAMIVVDSNPVHPEHWAYKWFPIPDDRSEAEGGLAYKYGKNGYYRSYPDTPKIMGYYLPPQIEGMFVKPFQPGLENEAKEWYIDLAKTLDEDGCREQIKGFAPMKAQGSAVFPSFKRDLHVMKEAYNPQPGARVWAGADADKDGGIVLATINEHNQIVVFDEVYCDNDFVDAQITKFMDVMTARYENLDFRQGAVDPAGSQQRGPQGEQWIREMNRFTASFGMNDEMIWRPAPANGSSGGANHWPTRRDAVQRLLNARLPAPKADMPRMLISPRCKNLIRTLATWRYDDKRRPDGKIVSQFSPPKIKGLAGLGDALSYLSLLMLNTMEQARILHVEDVEKAKRHVNTNKFWDARPEQPPMEDPLFGGAPSLSDFTGRRPAETVRPFDPSQVNRDPFNPGF